MPRLLPVFLALLLFPAALPAADRLWLADGRALEGSLRADEDGRFHCLVAFPQGRADVPCAAGEIERVELEKTPAQARLLAEGGDSAAWRAWWEERRPFLALPGSDAGEAGLGLANALFQEGDAAGAATVALQVKEHDADAARRDRAEALGFAAAPSRDAAQTEAAARAFLARPEADVAARADAWFALGRIASARWAAAPDAEKPALLEAALDAFLRAPVLLPHDRARAARGLLEAARLESAAGDGLAARRSLDELCAAFPDPGLLSSARTLRAQL